MARGAASSDMMTDCNGSSRQTFSANRNTNAANSTFRISISHGRTRIDTNRAGDQERRRPEPLKTKDSLS